MACIGFASFSYVILCAGCSDELIAQSRSPPSLPTALRVNRRCLLPHLLAHGSASLVRFAVLSMCAYVRVRFQAKIPPNSALVFEVELMTIN